jgi:AraC-like DNA-binding protein
MQWRDKPACLRRISPGHLKCFGQPRRVCRKPALNEARRRLASRRKTVRSVAESVGFANPEVFRRAFQRRFGDHPTRLMDSKSALSLNPYSALRETAVR